MDALEHASLADEESFTVAKQHGTWFCVDIYNGDDTAAEGEIEKGRYGDLIAVSGDPLTDVSRLTSVAFVMKGGVVVKDQRWKTSRPRRTQLVVGRRYPMKLSQVYPRRRCVAEPPPPGRRRLVH